MSGVQRALQLGWLGVTAALVAAHLKYQHPFSDARDAATLLALVALAVRALLAIWRWADLAWRKLWLWLINASVNWTLEVRIGVPQAIEEADIRLLANDLREARARDRISRSNGSDAVSIDTESGYGLAIRPLQSGNDSYWVMQFRPVHIGYRDASRVLQRVFVPIIDAVSVRIKDSTTRMYSVEARFSRLNPYAAVLLNELRAKSADRVLLSFKQESGTVQITKDSVTSSSMSQADAVHAMSTVFGLSLRGALSAGYL